MQFDNLQMLKDTFDIFKRGYYIKHGKTVYTKLSQQEREECYVYLPEDVKHIMERKDFEHVHVFGRMGVGCQNVDSFAMALEQYKYKFLFSEKKKIMFLY